MKTIATVLLAYVIASAAVYAVLDIAGLQMMVGIYSNGVVVSTMPAAAPASLWWIAFNIATCIAALGALLAVSRKHGVVNQTVHFNVAADADPNAIVAAFGRVSGKPVNDAKWNDAHQEALALVCRYGNISYEAIKDMPKEKLSALFKRVVATIEDETSSA